MIQFLKSLKKHLKENNPLYGLFLYKKLLIINLSNNIIRLEKGDNYMKLEDMTVEELKKLRKDLAYSNTSIDNYLEKNSHNSIDEEEYNELMKKADENTETIIKIDSILEKKQIRR